MPEPLSPVALAIVEALLGLLRRICALVGRKVAGVLTAQAPSPCPLPQTREGVHLNGVRPARWLGGW